MIESDSLFFVQLFNEGKKNEYNSLSNRLDELYFFRDPKKILTYLLIFILSNIPDNIVFFLFLVKLYRSQNEFYS